MLYQNRVFTLPATDKAMTDEAYEVAVGIRCPDCKKKFGKTKHVCQKDQLELFSQVDKPWCPYHDGWCAGCGRPQPCQSDCPAGTTFGKQCKCADKETK